MTRRSVIQEILDEHNYLIEVPMEFMIDKFNLQCLNIEEDYLSISYAFLLNKISLNCPDVADYVDEYIFYARQLYIELHQRYILSIDGLNDMKKKIETGVYGFCKNSTCRNAKNEMIRLLPGIEDCNFNHSKKNILSLYCTFCDKYSTLDDHEHWLGDAFGTSFIAKYVIQYGADRCAQIQTFKPRLFGFTLHQTLFKNIPQK